MSSDSHLPETLRAHLAHPSLTALWHRLRERLERNGHLVQGSVRVELDDQGADRLAGLLGRTLRAGTVSVRLADLDAALRDSVAARGLVAVVGALTGSGLRDRPAERASRERGWEHIWQDLDDALVNAGLATGPWVPDWLNWLHGSGVVRRLGTDQAGRTLHDAVSVLATLPVPLPHPEPVAPRPELVEGPHPEPVAPHPELVEGPHPEPVEGPHPEPVEGPDPHAPTMLAALAARTTGSAHGLDEGRTVTALVTRAVAIAYDLPVPDGVAARRGLWQRVGVETDAISGTVITWGLRPPGDDPWSQMMNQRAELGLMTHLTIRDLDAAPARLVPPGQLVHACENPQVLQSLVDTGVTGPLLCLSGNPTSAGLRLVSALRPRYHGDFDWPGVAIAARVLAAGAAPWRMSGADYRAAIDTADRPAEPLTGPSVPTPWDPTLETAMTEAGVAVHEEAMIEALRADLS